jgi:FkbM family methyltransferase
MGQLLTLFRFIVLVAALASAIVFIYSAFNTNSFLVGEAGSSSNFDYSVFSGTINSSSLGYRHANFDLNPATVCTEEQRSKISEQIVIGDRLNFNVGCFDSNWLDAFFAEEADIGTHEFVGISVGCNKGTDAVLAARMGMNDPAYDASVWLETIGTLSTACSSREQQKELPPFFKRSGEMHCIEPMPNNFYVLKNASNTMGLNKEEFVVTHAAVSSRNGIVKFPDGEAGQEAYSITHCDQSPSIHNPFCVDVNMYSLDSYVEKFVKSRGPINMLSIDAEGWDFDVLFGGSSTLDRTLYLEYETHTDGNWGKYKIMDSVRLLDGKGFTCYWMFETDLWRITECYLDVYENLHIWSNVGCVHRSYTILYDRMEARFNSSLGK